MNPAEAMRRRLLIVAGPNGAGKTTAIDDPGHRPIDAVYGAP